MKHTRPTVTIPKAAAIAGVTTRTIRNWLATGKLASHTQVVSIRPKPTTRRKTVIDAAELRALVEKRREEA